MLNWADGKYPHTFMAKVIAWYELHKAVIMNIEDASTPNTK